MADTDTSEPVLPVHKNPLALASLVVGGVAVLLSGALALGQSTAGVSGSGLQALVVIGTIRTVLTGLLGVTALVLGLIALLLPHRTARPTAAAGLAIGAVLVFEALTAVLSSVLVRG